MAIGLQDEDLDSSNENDDAGMVNIMLGFEPKSSGIDGISDLGSQIWNQDLVTIIGDAFGNEFFGNSVAAAIIIMTLSLFFFVQVKSTNPCNLFSMYICSSVVFVFYWCF